MLFFIHKHINEKKHVSAIDRLMMVASIAYPLTALPQVYTIYHTHMASGVSLATWLSFMAFGVIFLAYGITHRLRPLIWDQIIWFVVDALIVLGALMYGK